MAISVIVMSSTPAEEARLAPWRGHVSFLLASLYDARCEDYSESSDRIHTIYELLDVSDKADERDGCRVTRYRLRFENESLHTDGEYDTDAVMGEVADESGSHTSEPEIPVPCPKTELQAQGQAQD